MDKDRVKGKAKDIAGRVQRQAGEWTGDDEAQLEGAAKQAEGKLQNLVGRTKDAARKTADDLHGGSKTRKTDEEIEVNETTRTSKSRKAA